MKLIIDISEKIRVCITQVGLQRLPDDMIKAVDAAIQEGVPLQEDREVKSNVTYE